LFYLALTLSGRSLKNSAVARIKSNRSRTHCYDHPRPALTVDIALFTSSGNRVEVLLIQRARDPFKGLWAFPGGFVDKDESLDQAAARELLEETSLSRIHLEQIGAFGDPGRDPRGHTVSVVFAAVLDCRVLAQAGDDASAAAWHSARRPPELAFDHRKILSIALKRMAGRLS
jgi:8-oxo-dGTP diphosphatase